MRGHVAGKGDVWHAVIHEGVDPITGKERRRWHRVGSDRGCRQIQRISGVVECTRKATKSKADEVHVRLVGEPHDERRIHISG